MIFEVGKEIIIPMLITDSLGNPVSSGVNPTIVIKRGDGKYWNGTTSIWVDTLIENVMIFSFMGTYIYSFIPQTEDFFIIRCSESAVYHIEDGVAFRTVARLSNLDNLDNAISSRLPASSYIAPDNTTIANINSKVDIIDTNVDIINTNVADIDSKVDTTVSSRSNHNVVDVWTYNTRTLSPTNADGIGVNTVTITVTKDSVVESGVEVYVYDVNRVAKLSAVSDINGQVIFKVDNGLWYFEFVKSGLWSKEISQNISGNLSFSVDMDSIGLDDNLIVEFRKLNDPVLELNNDAVLAIEAYGNGDFVISSATATVTGIVEPVVCSISGYKIYCNFTVGSSGWVIIKFNVIIGGVNYPFEIKKYVD